MASVVYIGNDGHQGAPVQQEVVQREVVQQRWSILQQAESKRCEDSVYGLEAFVAPVVLLG